ncbi:MAG: hypothetical protein LBT25_00415 [Candidatus Symbiothrix sp.]|jgi:hypothetical protein|nr:hypothetical protein [Candidatus Symbiothrix sp.]
MYSFLSKGKRQFRRFIKSVQIKYRLKNGYYAIDIDTLNMGLGARIVNMLEILLYCDTMAYTPVLRFNYKEKKSHPDYFKELFYYKQLPASVYDHLKFTSIEDTSDLLWKNYDKRLRLDMAKSLFDKYLGFNQNILDEVDSFTSRFFTGKQVLGIHYRGTDKVNEAPAVQFDNLIQNIAKIVDSHTGIDLIFVSTDDVKVLQYMAGSAFGIPVIFREDAIRSEDGMQIHLKEDHSKVVINHDAIVNCLILSRCRYLLKTASFLSDCSVIFNPAIKVSVINAPYEYANWWPASEMNEFALIN